MKIEKFEDLGFPPDEEILLTPYEKVIILDNGYYVNIRQEYVGACRSGELLKKYTVRFLEKIGKIPKQRLKCSFYNDKEPVIAIIKEVQDMKGVDNDL